MRPDKEFSKALMELRRASLVVQTVKNLPAAGDLVQSLGWEDPWRRKWQPTPVFLEEILLGIPMDRGAWLVTVHGVSKTQK